MFWYILGIIIALIIQWVIASEMKNIAESKGHAEASRYFWFSFWLGLPGWLMVAALPNKNLENLLVSIEKNEKQKAAPPQTPAAPAPKKVEAPAAAPTSQSSVSKEAPADPGDGTAVAIPVEDGRVKCSVCGTVQNTGRKVCWNCSSKFVSN